MCGKPALNLNWGLLDGNSGIEWWKMGVLSAEISQPKGKGSKVKYIIYKII